ncbi:MAG: hypothetical protein AAFY57_10960 [Cyanobacteria bacterium J06642_2]
MDRTRPHPDSCACGDRNRASGGDCIVGMFFDGTPPTNLSLEQLAELEP